MFLQPRLTYDKSIQTAPQSSSSSSPPPDESPNLHTGGVSSSVPVATVSETELRAQILAEMANEKSREANLKDEELRKGLSPEELHAVYGSSDFASFLEGSTKIVQRALSDGYDYLRDYTVSGGDAGVDDQAGRRVRMVCAFGDERWTKNRSVTDVDWSPKVRVAKKPANWSSLTVSVLQFPELSLASYNKNPMAVNEPDGIVCVWNLHLLERPEFIFHSQVWSPFFFYSRK
jgi:dynein intermediate chain